VIGGLGAAGLGSVAIINNVSPPTVFA